jgi:uncharacterized protein YodC (DUF2158 family)
MSDTTFSVGDVVKLVSGGPDLTIIAILDNGVHLVTWFENGAICRTKLPKECMVKSRKEEA